MKMNRKISKTKILGTIKIKNSENQMQRTENNNRKIEKLAACLLLILFHPIIKTFFLLYSETWKFNIWSLFLDDSFNCDGDNSNHVVFDSVLNLQISLFFCFVLYSCSSFNKTPTYIQTIQNPICVCVWIRYRNKYWKFFLFSLINRKKNLVYNPNYHYLLLLFHYSFWVFVKKTFNHWYSKIFWKFLEANDRIQSNFEEK